MGDRCCRNCGAGLDDDAYSLCMLCMMECDPDYRALVEMELDVAERKRADEAAWEAAKRDGLIR